MRTLDYHLPSSLTNQAAGLRSSSLTQAPLPADALACSIPARCIARRRQRPARVPVSMRIAHARILARAYSVPVPFRFRFRFPHPAARAALNAHTRPIVAQRSLRAVANARKVEPRPGRPLHAERDMDLPRPHNCLHRACPASLGCIVCTKVIPRPLPPLQRHHRLPAQTAAVMGTTSTSRLATNRPSTPPPLLSPSSRTRLLTREPCPMAGTQPATHIPRPMWSSRPPSSLQSSHLSSLELPCGGILARGRRGRRNGTGSTASTRMSSLFSTRRRARLPTARTLRPQKSSAPRSAPLRVPSQGGRRKHAAKPPISSVLRRFDSSGLPAPSFHFVCQRTLAEPRARGPYRRARGDRLSARPSLVLVPAALRQQHHPIQPQPQTRHSSTTLPLPSALLCATATTFLLHRVARPHIDDRSRASEESRHQTWLGPAVPKRSRFRLHLRSSDMLHMGWKNSSFRPIRHRRTSDCPKSLHHRRLLAVILRRMTSLSLRT